MTVSFREVDEFLVHIAFPIRNVQQFLLNNAFPIRNTQEFLLNIGPDCP